MKLSARAKTLPGFLKQIVSTFKCDYFSDEDISYMAVDYNLVCEDGGRKSFSRICWETYAALMVFIFPIGIPLTFGVLLYQRRYDLCPKMKVRGVSYILFRQDDWGKEVEPPEGSKQRCAHLLFPGHQHGSSLCRSTLPMHHVENKARCRLHSDAFHISS